MSCSVLCCFFSSKYTSAFYSSYIFIHIHCKLLSQNSSPFTPDNSVAFPKMASVEVEGHEDDPKQPALDDDGAFIWPGDEGVKRKPVPGVFVLEKYLTPTEIGDPI